MSWSMNTLCRNHSVRKSLILGLGVVALAAVALSQDLNVRVPSAAVAGESISIGTTGSGSATFYLIGPTVSLKHDVQLGSEIVVPSKQTEIAGQYKAVVCVDHCQSADFYVAPAKPASLTFLVHPSRVPVGQNDAISGVALAFDEFGNLIFEPSTVDFQLAAKGSALTTRSVQTQNGIAWFRAPSGKAAGALQVTASLHDVSARRVVQQVASDPCNLRIKGQRTPKGVLVETEPIRDCAGNPVPDGTVVTFTAKNGNEISTVDAPVKQDVARAQIQAKGTLVVSAASGVVMGNELRLEAQ
jgi:hypothetical protein